MFWKQANISYAIWLIKFEFGSNIKSTWNNIRCAQFLWWLIKHASNTLSLNDLSEVKWLLCDVWIQARMWRGWREVVLLCGGNVYTHTNGQCQLFDVQHDELWVYVIEWQGVRCMLTVAESCYLVFELVIDMYGRFVLVLVISFISYKAQIYSHIFSFEEN